MVRDVVRTVPPWVIQRPPQALAPQHNHSPSDPRTGSSSSRRDDDEDRANSEGGDEEDGIFMPTLRPVPGSSAGAPGTASGTAATADTAATAVPAVPATATSEAAPPTAGTQATAAQDIHETVTNSSGGATEFHGDLGYRISHLFMRKEGRKWDHLRSAEPVIVPQFHVPRTTSEIHGRLRQQRERAAAAAAAATTGATTSTARSTAARASSRAPWWNNPESQWRAFIESTRYPHAPHEKSEVIDDEEMQRLNLDEFGYHTALHPRAGGGDGGGGVGQFHHHRLRLWQSSGSSSGVAGAGAGAGAGPGAGGAGTDRKALYERVWQLVLHHPLGPLACRLTVLMTSIVALVVASEIFRREHLSSVGDLDDANSNAPERTQIIVAIVVDVVAVPYIGYITVDDYTGKPLGLRPTKDRIRLILTDLFFIIFKSASTALGFEAMIFTATQKSGGLLRALGAFELIGLVSWAMTLCINVFREIERLGG